MNNTDQKIRDYFGSLESRWGYKFVLWDAKHFGYYPDKVANIPERRALELQQDQIAQKLSLKPGQTILDAGCGRGVTACYLAKKYAVRVVGIDMLDFEIDRARKRAQSKGLLEKTQFEVMNFDDLKFSEGYFHAVYVSECLSHAPNVSKVLSQLFRVLRPGGKLVLMEYTLALDEAFSAEDMKSMDFIIKGSAMFGLKTFRHNRFPAILQSVGFEDVREENITDNFLPSLLRLYKKSKLVYPVTKLLGFPQWLFNTAVPTKLLPLVRKDLFRYCIFTAVKPSQSMVLSIK